MFISKTNEAKIHPVLNNLAIYYPQTGLIAEKVAPVLKVEEGQEDGEYPIFSSKTGIQGGIETVRALGTRASTFDWKITLGSYHAEEHSLEKAIDWREFKKFKNHLDLAKTTQEATLELLLTSYEVRVATLLTTTGNYGSSSYYTSLSGTQCWDDFVNSDPEADIETAREAVGLGAAEPNTIVIPVNVWRTARRHPAIRAIMKEENNSQLTEDGFPKKLFGLNALFAGGRQNTVLPGATESISRIWGDNVWVGVVAPRPSKKAMTFAYSIRCEGMKSETYEDKPRKSDVIRIQHAIQAEEICCNTAGYLIQNTIT